MENSQDYILLSSLNVFVHQFARVDKNAKRIQKKSATNL
jgi:hypothetical protein